MKFIATVIGASGVLLFAASLAQAPAPPASGWLSGLSPESITLLTSAAVLVLGAFFGGLVKVINAFTALKTTVHDTKATVAETKQAVETNAEQGRTAGAVRDAKLDTIKHLADGHYAEVLQELAEVKRTLAEESGRRADQIRAEAAQQRADEHVARVEAAVAVEAARTDVARADAPVLPVDDSDDPSRPT